MPYLFLEHRWSSNWTSRLRKIYLIYKQLQDEGGNAAVDSNEEVDGGQKYISCAWDSEHKGCWVHKRGYGPPVEQEEQDKSGQVGLRNVWLLLETDENQHHHDSRNGVV